MNNIYIFISIFLLIVNIGYSQTPSNDCTTAGASQITVNCTPVSFTAGTAIGSPAFSGCYGGTQDAWAWFTATSQESIIEYWNPNRDAAIYVYSGTCGALVNAGCADDYGSGVTESILIPTVIGNTYYVRIVRYSGTSGTMTGNLDVCPTCTYQLILYDAGCNGWNFADIQVFINGVSAGYGYPSSPQCSVTYNLRFYSGDVVELLYHYDGSTDSQNSFQLIDPWGNNIAAGSLNLSSDTWVAYTYPTCIQPPSVPDQDQDCGWAPTICSNATINGNSNGPGNDYELSLTNTGCLMGEHQSTWYFFQAQTAGTIGFTLTPTNGTDDYDFAIWNATTCPPAGAPIRCSWSSVNGNTGLGNGAVDLSESASGDSWLSTINAAAGQDYLMLIDNWSGSSSPYTLTWNLSGGASLDCTTLPMELLNFSADCTEDSVNIRWATATEKNNEYFILERSIDGVTWEEIYKRHGAGNSNLTMKYYFTDFNFYKNITNYYRLKQIDYNGNFTYSNIITTGCKFNNTSRLFIFSEPNSENVMISCIPENAGIYYLTAFDNLGRIIYREELYLDLIGKTMNIPKEKFKKGISFINLRNESNSISQKIIIY